MPYGRCAWLRFTLSGVKDIDSSICGGLPISCGFVGAHGACHMFGSRRPCAQEQWDDERTCFRVLTDA